MQQVGHTETAAGLIPHKTIRMAGLVFSAPVKVIQNADRRALPLPMASSNCYVYALPGGGAVAAVAA